MESDLHSFMKVGIVHFMAYPETMGGEGPILETIAKTVEDDFFGAIEVTRIKNEDARAAVAEMLRTGGLAVGFGTQPILLSQRLDLNSADPASRARAVEQVKNAVREAYALGAQRLAVLSGPDPGDAARPQAMELLADSLQQVCAYTDSLGDMGITLEVFDRGVDKKCLIGSTEEAVAISKAVRQKYRRFGLMIDLSHLPLQGETAAQSLGTAKDHLVHVHIGNCVKKDRSHPAYGDMHPRFGISQGENGVPELREFLRVLLDIGYIGHGQQKVVAFEVRPQKGETSGAVIANAKRTLREAWAGL